MSPEKIEELLSLGEGQRVEFKSTANSVDSLGRVICGFLNTTGGYIICGVENEGKVVGVDASEGAVSALEAKLHKGLSPKAFVAIEVQALNNKPVIVIEVPAGKDVPFAYRDTIFIRSGESTQKADVETIRDIVMRRQIEPERWERRFSSADLEVDLDLEEVKVAITESFKVRRAFFRDNTNPFMVLEDFAVSKYGRLTNAGDVLFGKNPANRLPQTRVRAVCYDVDKTGDTYRDMKSFEGPLERIFQEAYSFVIRNTPSISRFRTGNPKRDDSPLYPEGAVREGLINALAHRDYSNTSGGVSIHIFPKRLEIWNTGELPDGVTEESLATGHISVLRNPDIAHALYLRGLMEKSGRGSVVILNECEANGLPKPLWKSEANRGVTLTLFAPASISEKNLVVRSRNHKGDFMARNVVGSPVKGQDFFAREKISMRIEQLLDQGSNFILVGPRRSGKTSLMHRVIGERLERGWHAIFIDASACFDEVDFVKSLVIELARLPSVGAIGGRIDRFQKTISKLKRDDGLSDGIHSNLPLLQSSIASEVSAVFNEFSLNETHLLIGIDELPMFLRELSTRGNGAVRVERLLHWLRTIRQTQRDYVHWAFLGSIDLESFAADHNLSKAINDLLTIPLPPFTQDEADQFLQALGRGAGVEIGAASRRMIIDRIGWLQPFHLQLLFHQLVETGKRRIGVPEINAAFEVLTSQASAIHLDSWRQRLYEELSSEETAIAEAVLSSLAYPDQSLDEEGLLDAVSMRSGLGPSLVRAQLRDLLPRLEREGFLKKTDRGFAFASNLLRDYWRRRFLS